MASIQEKRAKFSGRLGYVLAVAGSAVGLGNIWRFPYLAAEYGGGTFLITYIVLVATFGFTLLISESALGRMTRKTPISAFRMLGAKKLMIGGWINAIVPMIILPYYCVIGGWVCKYLFSFVTGQAGQLVTDACFSTFIESDIEPIIWLFLFAGAAFLVVMAGVEKGIERVNKWMMPLLLIMAIAISIYTVTRPGALTGVAYYLIPDFSRFSLMTVVAAMGQIFYSLSIGMGILYTYGSYMKKDIDMAQSVTQVEIVDTLVAFLAGLMIIPAIFVFSGGHQPASLNAGPSLMFITLPKVFESIGFSHLIGSVFFLLVFFAALTSAISLLETNVATIQDQTGWRRKTCCLVMGAEIILLGVPCSLGFGLLDAVRPLNMTILGFFDFISNAVLMPIAAICTCLLIIKVVGTKAISDEVKVSSAFRREKFYRFSVRYLIIGCLSVILLSALLSAFGWITL